MDSDEVLILGVENSTECLCLGQKKVDKGKCSANPSRRRQHKSIQICSESDKDCLVIVDGENGSESDYIEVYGGDVGVKKLRHSSADNELECEVESPKVPTALHHNDSLVMMSVGKEEPKWSDISSGKLYPQISSSSTTVPPDALSSDSTDHAPIDHRHQADSSWTPLNDQTAPVVKRDNPALPKIGAQLHRTPTCWTNCPNCPLNMKRKYHLIDVAYDCAEWGVVSAPLTRDGFTVSRIQRVQNESLWQRLCYEKQLMLRDRQDVNEQLLYHTSRSAISIICEEGLDVRLSRNGCFGSGIYFSDSPTKCNCYWGHGVVSPTTAATGASRYMFCCRVLLGEIKTYPKGTSERLRREPAKTNPAPGELKFYDSVMGNLSGQNEFVVYNAYRVMPEYVLCYSDLMVTASIIPMPAVNAAYLYQNFNAQPPQPRKRPARPAPRKSRKKKK